MSAVSEQALRNTLPDRVRAVLYAMGITQGTGRYSDYERFKRVLVEWGLSSSDYSRAIKVAAEYIGI